MSNKIISKKLLLLLIGAIMITGWYSQHRLATTINKPNIILITVDALRPDHLGCYGYKRDTSPNIDKLAKNGILFTQAICQGGWTGGSLFSLITSAYPHTTGVIDWGNSLNYSLPTLGDLLRKHGYHTALINGHQAAKRLAEMGLVRGFDSWNKDKEGIEAGEITERAVKFLYENKNKKFFLWLHYFDTHGPYNPPSPYNKQYINDNLYKTNKHIPISDDQKISWLAKDEIPYAIQDKGITEVDYYTAQYDGEIRFTDEQIGILLRTVEELGLGAKTLIVLTADHGEGLGEHGLYFSHGLYLYDEIIKVPLIFKYSNKLSGGKKIKSMVGHIDIMPTVLSLLRIKPVTRMDGIDLVPPMLNKGDYHSQRIIFSEIGGYFSNPYNILIISMRSEKWKLIYYTEREVYKLYNLENDPQEVFNLVNIEKKEFNILKSLLRDWLSLQKTRIVHLSKPLDQEIRRKLESLGYLQ